MIKIQSVGGEPPVIGLKHTQAETDGVFHHPESNALFEIGGGVVINSFYMWPGFSDAAVKSNDSPHAPGEVVTVETLLKMSAILMGKVKKIDV